MCDWHSITKKAQRASPRLADQRGSLRPVAQPPTHRCDLRALIDDDVLDEHVDHVRAPAPRSSASARRGSRPIVNAGSHAAGIHLMSYVLRCGPEHASAPAAAPQAVFQSSFGMIRRMNSSNNGTVKAVSPWLGLQIIPLEMS